MGEEKMSRPSLHVGIVSWSNHYECARHISESLVSHCDALTVVYSNPGNCEERGAGNWIRTDDDHFYGRKFQRLASCVKEDILLLIQADANYPDWPFLVDDCRKLLKSQSDIAIWAPDIDYTAFKTEIVAVSRGSKDKIIDVTQTDGIVWATRSSILQRLINLDYSENNIGWGIEQVAIALAYLKGERAVRDLRHRVIHPRGSGYLHDVAAAQKMRFFDQLPDKEKRMVSILEDSVTRARSAAFWKSQAETGDHLTARALLKTGLTKTWRRLLRSIGR